MGPTSVIATFTDRHHGCKIYNKFPRWLWSPKCALTITFLSDYSVIIIGIMRQTILVLHNALQSKVFSLLQRPQKTQDPTANQKPPGARQLPSQGPGWLDQGSLISLRPGAATVTREGGSCGRDQGAGLGLSPRRSGSEGPRRPARIGAIRSGLSNLYRCREVGTAAFDHRIEGSWLWSHSGSRNKSKSTEPPSSPGLSIHPRATAGSPAAADSTCGSGGSAGRALDSNAPQPSPAKPLRERAQSPNPLNGDRSRGPGDERRAIAGREAVSTSAPPRRALSSELGAGQAGNGREGEGRAVRVGQSCLTPSADKLARACGQIVSALLCALGSQTPRPAGGTQCQYSLSAHRTPAPRGNPAHYLFSRRNMVQDQEGGFCRLQWELETRNGTLY